MTPFRRSDALKSINEFWYFFLYIHLISSIKIISKWLQRTPINSCFISPVSRARVRDIGRGGAMVAFVQFFFHLFGVFFSVLHKHSVLFNIIYGNLFINCNRKKERRHRLCDVKRICLFRRRRCCFSIKSRPRESWSMHAMMTPLTSSPSSSSPRSRQKSWRLQSVFRHGRGAMRCQQNVTKKIQKKNESENRKILFKHLPLLLRYAPMQCTLSAIAFIYVHRNPMRTVCLCLFCCGSCLRTATRVKTVMPSNEPTVHSEVEEKNAFETSNKIYCSSLAAIASHQQHWNAREKNTKRTSHTLQNETTNKRIKLLPNFTHTHSHTSPQTAHLYARTVWLVSVAHRHR